MPRTHLATHIVADEPSSRSGIVYSGQCLDLLVQRTNEAPVFFGRLEPDGFIANKDGVKATLVGFDIISDKLYVIVESDEKVIDDLLNYDYIIRFLSDTRKDGEEIIELNIKALLMERE